MPKVPPVGWRLKPKALIGGFVTYLTKQFFGYASVSKTSNFDAPKFTEALLHSATSFNAIAEMPEQSKLPLSASIKLTLPWKHRIEVNLS